MPERVNWDGGQGGEGGEGGGTDADAIHVDIANEISGIASKAAPISGDLIVIEDSEDGYVKKSVDVGDLVVSSDSADIDQSGGTADTYGVLVGAVDGDNTDFTLSSGAYPSGALLVFRNGQLLTQGTSEDWIELSPAAGTIRFNAAPNATDQISAAVIAGPRGTQGPQGEASVSVHHQQLIWTIEGTYLKETDEGTKPLKLPLSYVGAGATIEEVYILLGTAPSTTNLHVRILMNGSTIFTGTDYVEIATSETSASRTTGFVDSGACDKNDYFQLELVQGDVDAADITVLLRYKWTITGS